MSEQTDTKPSLLVDKEAGKRYEHVVQKGKKIFGKSSLVDPGSKISSEDLGLISLFHQKVLPINPNHPWRVNREKGRAIERGQIVDSSFFSNWEAPGGPLEHMNLAMNAARILTRLLQEHLRSGEEELTEEWVKRAYREVRVIDPMHAAAAAGLHDEGRQVTHLFYTTDLIGRRLLQRIGVREDIRKVLPDERVMLTPLNKSMDDAIQSLPAEAVIARIADELGKRAPGTNRLYQPEDFTNWDTAWAASYQERPFSGRPSEKFMRERMELHVTNVPRYFEALDNWVRTLTNITLLDLARRLNRELSNSLPLLSEKVRLTSKDMLDDELIGKEVQVGDRLIEIKGLTHIGGPNKIFNEDACVVMADGDNVQIFLVDGGTQIESVPSLGKVSGGKYITDKVVEFSPSLDPSKPLDENLRELNSRIGEDVRKNHPEINFTESSMNVPYGSIAGLKIDTVNQRVEIANAGDVFALAVKSDGKLALLTRDDVHGKDQRTLEAAQRVAREYGVTVRKAMEQRTSDLHFKPIIDEMRKTVRLGNIGRIRRITGSPNFDITHEDSIPLQDLREILIFSDGAVPLNIDIHTKEGQKRFLELLQEVGLEGLYEKVERAAQQDPDFEEHPRFRHTDDMLILQIKVK